jgi:archaellum component FlaG (FlaF/FlaG flagellin family)
VHVRSAATSLLAAAVLVATPVAGALAEDAPQVRPGVTKAEQAKAKAVARKLERKADKVKKFVLGGTVKAVDAAASTLTFTVHGGRYKALRKTDVTVTVALDAKVTRDGVVTLAEVLPGDHVVVKASSVDFGSEPGVLVMTVAPVHRVAASPAEADDEVEAPETTTTES